MGVVAETHKPIEKMPFIFGSEGPVKAKKVPIVKISSVSTEGDSPKTTASSRNPYE